MSLRIGSVGSSVVRITSISPLPRRSPDRALVASVSAVGACGGNEQQEPQPQPLPEEEQLLRTGVYRSEEFESSFSFRVGEGWSTDPPERKPGESEAPGHEER